MFLEYLLVGGPKDFLRPLKPSNSHMRNDILIACLICDCFTISFFYLFSFFELTFFQFLTLVNSFFLQFEKKKCGEMINKIVIKS